MSRRKSNSGAALDVGVAHAVARSAAGTQFEPSFARISGVRRAPRPPTWPPPLPADRVPVPPPKGGVATRTLQQPAPSPSAPPPPLAPRAVPAPAPVSARPAPSSAIAWPAPAVSSQVSGYPNPTARRTERSSPAPPAPLQASAYALPLRARGSPASARGPLAAPLVPGEGVPRLRPRVAWMLLLALLSAAAGAVLRDRLPAYAIDAVRATLAHPSAWIYAHVAAMGAAPTGHPLPARPESLPPPAVTAGVAPSSDPSAAPPASPEPPEVSVSSLPLASTKPRAAPAPARTAAFAPSIPRTRVAAHPAQPTAAMEESTATGPKARLSRTPARVPPPAVNKAPAPVPGSLDDLIRKEVEKDQKKH